MFDRVTEIMSLVLGALALGYLVYEIDRRQRKWHDIWDVLDGEDAIITGTLEDIVEKGELKPTPRRRWLDGRGGAFGRWGRAGDPYSRRRTCFWTGRRGACQPLRAARPEV
jgi:hypothetical protein